VVDPPDGFGNNRADADLGAATGSDPFGHMTGERFRLVAARLADWLTRYQGSIEERPVRSGLAPGDVLDMLPERAPEPPGGKGQWDRIEADLERVVLPGLLHWQHPCFFGYFPANTSWPSVLGDLVCAGLGVQGMLWLTSPACTELETRVLDWMAHAIGLDPSFTSSSPAGGGVIQGTASEATLVAMVAGRHRLRGRLGRGGHVGSGSAAGDDAGMVVYASRQAHSSVVKAAMIAGLASSPTDSRRIRLIDVDERGALDPGALAEAIARDRKSGLNPMFVCATIGTTGSTAVDPVRAIVDRCRGEGGKDFEGWIHVDAAHAGAALVCPEHRWMIDGVEGVDSFCFNPHKWLLTGFDCDLLWTRDRESLVGALSITPDYLRTPESESGDAIDYRDWQVPLGRRFRAIKLWFVLRHYGIEGLRAHVRHGVWLSEWLERRALEERRLELAAPRTCNLVCLRCARASDEDEQQREAMTRTLMERLNATGRVFVSGASVPSPDGVDRFAIRVAIGGTRTRFEHVERLWGLIVRELDRMGR